MYNTILYDDMTQIDLIVGAFAATEAYTKLGDYTFPWARGSVEALIPYPDTAPNINAIIKPFNLGVRFIIIIIIIVIYSYQLNSIPFLNFLLKTWIIIAGSILTTVVALFVIARLAFNGKNDRIVPLSFAIDFVVTVLLSQGINFSSFFQTGNQNRSALFYGTPFD